MRRSKADALRDSEDINEASSLPMIGRVLRLILGQTADPRIFRSHRLRTVRGWMREGLEFTRIAEIVIGGSVGRPQWSITSWAYFRPSIDDALRRQRMDIYGVKSDRQFEPEERDDSDDQPRTHAGG